MNLGLTPHNYAHPHSTKTFIKIVFSSFYWKLEIKVLKASVIWSSKNQNLDSVDKSFVDFDVGTFNESQSMEM
jgi:hypothetical protein